MDVETLICIAWNEDAFEDVVKHFSLIAKDYPEVWADLQLLAKIKEEVATHTQ